MTDLISEEWRSVVGFEGVYEVSNQGRVRSVDRRFINARGQVRTYPGVTLKPSVQKNGYLSVALVRGESRNRRRNIHRLVMEAFVGLCPDDMEVRHLDGDKANNEISNLRYGTRRENMLDQVRHGTHVRSKRTHCPRGHALQEPNLVKAHIARGMRDCRACGQTWSYFTHRPDSTRTFQEVSDWKYAAIMRKAVPNG